MKGFWADEKGEKMRVVSEIEIERVFQRAKKDILSVVDEKKGSWMYTNKAGEWMITVLDEVRGLIIDKCEECN